MSTDGDPRHDTEDPPPLLGTWPRLYAAVLGFLAFLITFFYFFSRAFQ